MSRQLRNIKIYPLTENRIQVVTDQEDLSIGADENKVIARTPDHFPIGTDSIHASVKDGAGTILSVISTDPLSVVSTGYSGLDIAGYDGLVTSSDGYIRARGVIHFSTSTPQTLVNPAWLSIDGDYYYMGGADLIADAYTDAIWHSTNAFNWERLATPPWSARAGAQLVSNGTDLWLIGGRNNAGPTNDLWHATVDAFTGELTWDGSAVATGITLLSNYFKATYHEDLNDAYIGAGQIDLDTGATTAFDFGLDSYGSLIHYDSIRNTLWFSSEGLRREYIINETGVHLGDADSYGAYGYVHYQETAAATWNITHNLSSDEVVPVVYASNKTFLEPVAWNVLDSSSIRLEFNSAVSGRALVCYGKYYSGTTWTLTDGYLDQQSAWFAVDMDGSILSPASITQPDTLNWNASVDGYLLAWRPFEGLNRMGGRRYIASITSASGDNEVQMYQSTNAALSVIRSNDSSMTLIEPSSQDYTDETTPLFALNAAAGAVLWSSFDLRHDGYQDSQEPYTGNFLSLSANTIDDQTVYMVGSGGVWLSGDAGVHWNRKSAIGVELSTTDTTPLVLKDNVVSVLDKDSNISRSLDAGDNFTTGTGGIGSQSITWYGSLGITPDTTYKVFIYKRPSDIIWESDYGHMPGEILDDFNTHYVLPYPAVIDSGNTQTIQITLDSEYDRDVEENEWEDHWLYLSVAATGAVVDRVRILRHDAGEPGDQITIYCKELNTTPTASHVVQVIKPRPEGAVYYAAIMRNKDLQYTLYHETDGTAFIESQEQEYDYYADRVSQGGLPSLINTTENLAKVNTLHGELNRQRVINKQFYNDPFTLPPELLAKLGSQLGLDLDENLDLRTQRRLVNLWFPQVDAYGGCLDGVKNLIDLMLGADSGVDAYQLDPNSDTLAGKTLTVTVSNYADHSFIYDSTENVVLYDSANEKWGMEIATADVDAELGSLIHSSVIHFRNSLVDGPLLITDHDFNGVSSITTLFFDEARIAELSLQDIQSVIGIYSEPKQRKLFKFINTLRKITPFWVQIKLA